jgi:hypothetical protein
LAQYLELLGLNHCLVIVDLLSELEYLQSDIVIGKLKDLADKVVELFLDEHLRAFVKDSYYHIFYSDFTVQQFTNKFIKIESSLLFHFGDVALAGMGWV